jgi:hypothetical protein
MSHRSHSMRGAGFGPVLAAQRAYAQQAEGRSKFGLVVPEAFIRGIRDLGYRGNGDAIAELIDNAIQAYADRVDVVFGYAGSSSGKKPVQLAVIDNGHGMEPSMIRMAVMWGGTHREGDRKGLGRYGYGLPCSSVSLGRRFTVYSQVAGSGLHAVSLDLDDLAAGAYTDTVGDIVVPKPVQASLPPFVQQQLARAYPSGWHCGTVVVIDKLDRLEWSTAQGLRENLSRQFGATYHKLRNETALYVDDRFVEPVDPLFLTPHFHLHALDDDRANAFDPIRIEARNPENRSYMGAINLRYSWLPPSFGSIDKGRDAVGLNANERFTILKEYHGLVFSRNGRLIDVQTRTPWTTFINNDRYIKVEIEFSAALDEAFGVTTSKQQVTVSPFIWDLLRRHGLPKAIEQLRNKVREAKAIRRMVALCPGEGEQRVSERAMGVASTGVPREASQSASRTRPALSPYQVRIEHAAKGPFFRIEEAGDVRILHLNSAHRFYDQIYDAPASNAEFRAAMEVLLFSLGDVILDCDGESDGFGQAHVISWSARLEAALSMLASHLSQDSGQGGEDDGGEPEEG